MTPFLSPTTPTDALPVDYMVPSPAGVSGSPALLPDVGAVPRDIDADETFDYFQAQGRIARERMEGRGA